jgi:hypothetical protein
MIARMQAEAALAERKPGLTEGTFGLTDGGEAASVGCLWMAAIDQAGGGFLEVFLLARF